MQRALLSGFLSYGPGVPAFGLPVFRSTDNRLFIQIVDEISGLVSSFRRVDVAQDQVVLISGFYDQVVGRPPVHVFVSQGGEAIFGTLEEISDRISIYLDSRLSDPSVILQLVELIGSEEDRRFARRSMYGHLLAKIGPSVAESFRHSSALELLWQRLIDAAPSREAAKRVLKARREIVLNISGNSDVSVGLGNIDPSDIGALTEDVVASYIQDSMGLLLDGESIRWRNILGDMIQEDFAPISPREMEIYLDRRLGIDNRIGRWNYNTMAGLVNDLGFKSIAEIDRAISVYNDGQISRAAVETRWGQIGRFELLLLATMGEEFMRRRQKASLLRSGYYYSLAHWSVYLRRLVQAGIPVGTYVPEEPPELRNVEAPEFPSRGHAAG